MQTDKIVIYHDHALVKSVILGFHRLCMDTSYMYFVQETEKKKKDWPTLFSKGLFFQYNIF